MARQGVAKTTAKPKRETFTIGFRVDAYTLAQLEKGAAAYGLSVHEYARQRLLELLERQDEARTLDAVAEMRQEIRALREEMRACLLETNTLVLMNLVEEERPNQVRDEVAHALQRAEEMSQL
jgi:hypothetical protein